MRTGPVIAAILKEMTEVSNRIGQAAKENTDEANQITHEGVMRLYVLFNTMGVVMERQGLTNLAVVSFAAAPRRESEMIEEAMLLIAKASCDDCPKKAVCPVDQFFPQPCAKG